MKTENLLFENSLSELLKSNPNQFSNEISEFIFAPSKRLRPRLIFACQNALGAEITQAHIDLAVAIEVLHSATLVHDDIIDKSLKRRGLETFYKKYGERMSVILGDYLFSLSIKSLCKTNNIKIFEIFSQSLEEICNGEIEQYFLQGKIPTFEQYIKKTTQKTALLFVCAIKCALELSGIKNPNIENFALNFGIAFQIKNDIDDYENSKADYKNDIYTLPDIFHAKYPNDCDIINKCNETKMEFIERARKNAAGFDDLIKLLEG